MPAVVRTIEVKAAPKAVWRWLASQEALRRWISPTLEIDLRVGGSYRLLGPDEATRISGTVLEIVPEKRLALSWLEEGAGWAQPTRFAIELAPSGAGTEVTLTHDGFEGIGSPRWGEIVKAYELGADRHHLLQRLQELVTVDGA